VEVSGLDPIIAGMDVRAVDDVAVDST